MSTSQTTVNQNVPRCIICWEPFTTRATLMPCGHEYDFECILPWFQSVVQQSRRDVILPCPLCRQHAKFIKHAYTSSGKFSTFDLIMYFSRTERIGPGNQPQRYRGPLRDLVLVGPTEDKLDIERITAMGPHQTEAFVTFLRGQPAQVARLNKEHLRIVAERRSRFMDLLGSAAVHARERQRQPISSFPGFTQQDSLDWDAINMMNREELATFRNIITIRGWSTFEDRQRLYHRSFELENPTQLRGR
ncbi:hypothetical protein N431DRAFT_342650 [Stipitochalara longipes BDJ]|nr:hypothetical protein N431DRAFT_342650 [Stipitochalara longipes BDJ]